MHRALPCLLFYDRTKTSFSSKWNLHVKVKALKKAARKKFVIFPKIFLYDVNLHA